MNDHAMLGVSPGSRFIGYAVMHRGEIVIYGIKPFLGKWSKSKLHHILYTVEKLLGYHKARSLVLKQIDPIKSSPQLDLLVKELMKLAKRKGIKVYLYSLHDLEQAAGRRGRNIKKGIAEHVLEKCPELKHTFLKEQNNSRPYYSKMFEAIAAVQLHNDE